MGKLEQFLKTWPHPLLRDYDLTVGLGLNSSQMHSLVHRALKTEVLTSLRRGLYLIEDPYRKVNAHPFTLAQSIYNPSYVSFESALSYHGWIPETVHIIMSSTSKRMKKFKNRTGVYHYYHIPKHLLYEGVERVGTGAEAFLLANPWKAIADHFYVFKRPWGSLDDLSKDLRIEIESVQASDHKLLKQLSAEYPSRRVQKLLKKIYREL